MSRGNRPCRPGEVDACVLAGCNTLWRKAHSIHQLCLCSAVLPGMLFDFLSDIPCHIISIFIISSSCFAIEASKVIKRAWWVSATSHLLSLSSVCFYLLTFFRDSTVAYCSQTSSGFKDRWMFFSAALRFLRVVNFCEGSDQLIQICSKNFWRWWPLPHCLIPNIGR